MKHAWTALLLLCALSVAGPRGAAPLPADVDLVAVWTIGGDGEEIIGRITQAFENRQGEICLLDSQLSRVLVYGRDGEALRAVGREGEGPGEFSDSEVAFSLRNGYAVIQSLPVKLIVLDSLGLPRSNVIPRLSEEEFAKFWAIGYDGCSWEDSIVLACIHLEEGDGMAYAHNELLLIDTWGRRLRRLAGDTHVTQMNEISEREEKFFRHRFAAHGSRFYVAPSWEYEIEMLDAGGDSARATGEAPLRKRTPQERERIAVSLGADTEYGRQMRIAVEDFDRGVQQLDIGPEGRLWVLSGAEACGDRREGLLGAFDVYSPDLDFLGRVSLHSPDDLRTDDVWVLGDRVVVVKDAKAAGPEADATAGDTGSEIQVICYEMRTRN